MVEEEMIQKQEDPTIPIKRDDVWIETHTRKNRTVLPSAEPLMEKVMAKIVVQSESSSSVLPLSIDDDPLSKVFHKKLRGGLPRVGSHVTKSQYNASLPGHILCSEERVEKEMIVKKYERMDTKLDFVIDFCKKDISHAQAAGGTLTPKTHMINTKFGQYSSGMNSMTSARNEPTPSAKLCKLLDWEGNCVAIAKEVTDPVHRANFHNYVLYPLLELKVSMVTRKTFHTKLYKAEKNPDAKTIGEVGVNDFLKWPKSHIKYMEQ